MNFLPKEHSCLICGATYGLSSMLNAHIEKTHYPLDGQSSLMKLDNLIRIVETLEARMRILEEENHALKAGK